LQEKEIEEEDDDNAVVVFFIAKKEGKNILKKREGMRSPFTISLKLLSSSCVAPKLLLPSS
jgi:hypothetical protein